MSDITVIGLGLMGSAGADDAGYAITASPVTVICIDNYAVANALH